MYPEPWQGISLNCYRNAVKLSDGGNKVHLIFWNEKPLIENLGSGSVDVAAALLGNSDASQMYGNVINADISEILQSLLYKFINGDALQLYHNEIGGVDAPAWKAFPKALIISDKKIVCDKIEDRITEIKDLSDFVL